VKFFVTGYTQPPNIQELRIIVVMGLHVGYAALFTGSAPKLATHNRSLYSPVSLGFFRILKSPLAVVFGGLSKRRRCTLFLAQFFLALRSKIPIPESVLPKYLGGIPLLSLPGIYEMALFAPNRQPIVTFCSPIKFRQGLLAPTF
jgi:hypothetical protein